MSEITIKNQCFGLEDEMTGITREEAATDFIRSLLSGGRRLASDCEAKLEAAGFKKSTYKKSKKKAGVRSVKDGFLWYWTLPEVEKPIENGQEVTDEDDLPI